MGFSHVVSLRQEEETAALSERATVVVQRGMTSSCHQPTVDSLRQDLVRMVEPSATAPPWLPTRGGTRPATPQI